MRVQKVVWESPNVEENYASCMNQAFVFVSRNMQEHTVCHTKKRNTDKIMG